MREIRLSEKAIELSDTPRVSRAVRKIWRQDEYPAVISDAYGYSGIDYDSALELCREYVKSPEFAQLSAAEKASAARGLGLLFAESQEELEQLQWQIRPPANFGVESIHDLGIATTIPAESDDGLLLSGLAMLDVAAVDPKILPDYKKFGHKSLLDFANNLGALILHSEYNDVRRDHSFKDVTPVVFEPIPGLERKTYVSGDAHGDFVARQTVGSNTKALSPTGRNVDFSPLQETAYIKGYHSVEPILLTACLAHAAVVIPPKELPDFITRLYDKILKIIEAQKNVPVIPAFGDFGETDNKRYKHLLKDHLRNRLPAQLSVIGEPGTGFDLGSYTFGDELHMRNFSINDTSDFTSTPGSLRISTQELPDFIAAIIGAANLALVRTDPKSLIELVEIFKAHFN